jgi:hypothetical protein
LAKALNEEFRYRYHHQKNHEAYNVIEKLKEPPLPNIGLTEFHQTMPDEYKIKRDPVGAYRRYYIGMKKSFATWVRRKKPAWFVD